MAMSIVLPSQTDAGVSSGIRYAFSGEVLTGVTSFPLLFSISHSEQMLLILSVSDSISLENPRLS